MSFVRRVHRSMFGSLLCKHSERMPTFWDASITRSKKSINKSATATQYELFARWHDDDVQFSDLWLLSQQDGELTLVE